MNAKYDDALSQFPGMTIVVRCDKSGIDYDARFRIQRGSAQVVLIMTRSSLARRGTTARRGGSGRSLKNRREARACPTEYGGQSEFE